MTGRRVVRSDDAENDVLRIAMYLADEAGLDVAGRFLDRTEAAFSQLAEMPLTGSPREFRSPALAKVRTWPVPGFESHLIFYRPLTEGIEVLRVVHGARDLPSVVDRPAEEG